MVLDPPQAGFASLGSLIYDRNAFRDGGRPHSRSPQPRPRSLSTRPERVPGGRAVCGPAPCPPRPHLPLPRIFHLTGPYRPPNIALRGVPNSRSGRRPNLRSLSPLAQDLGDPTHARVTWSAANLARSRWSGSMVIKPSGGGGVKSPRTGAGVRKQRQEESMAFW